MKYIRNAVLQCLSVLAISSGNVYAMSPESCPAGAFMDAHKLKLSRKMLATMDDYFGPNATLRIHSEGNDSFFKTFQEQYDEYRSYFPQSDALVDQALSVNFHIRMKEKLLEIVHLQKELKYKKEQKSIVNNCAIFGTAAGLTAAILSYLADGNIESVYALGSKYALGASAVAWAVTYMGKAMLEPDISYFNIQLKVGAKQLAQLNEAYAYVFPGELRLSDQIGELILIDRLKL